MVTTVDVDNIFNKCLTTSSLELLTATAVAKYMDSPFAIYCDNFVSDNEKDSVSKYQKLLFERGKKHETKTVEENYPDIVSIPFKTREEGFKLSLKSMASGSKVLHSIPVFYLPEGLSGDIDVLEKSNSESSVFGNYYYNIKEIKLAKNIQNNHIIQGAFYNYVLGKIQGITPTLFYIINRDGHEFSFKYSDYEELLLKNIEGSRRIIKGKPISATYNNCKFPWTSYCNRIAEETNDISLVAGISLKTKNNLISYGYKTVKGLASASIDNLLRINGIGAIKGSQYIYAAQAIQGKKIYHKE